VKQWRGDIALSLVIALGSVISLQSSGAATTAIAAQVVAALSLALRRVSPFVPTLVVLACTVATVLLTPTGPGDVFYLAIWIVGVYACGAHLPLTLSWVALALWWVTLFASVNGELIWGDLAFMGILTLGAWLPGVMARRAEQARQAALALADAQKRQAERGVADERARIARELHDIVAHAIGVMVVHAGAAQGFLDRDPRRASQALDIVQDSGAEAVLELRRMLRLLRDGASEPVDAPMPRIAQVKGLLAKARTAGHVVDLDLAGDLDRLSPAMDLTGFRIVQEAVTNAMKHAPGSAIRVSIGLTDRSLEVRVTNDLAGGQTAASHGTGSGLTGLRERVSVFTGELTAGPVGDTWLVDVRLPLGESLMSPAAQGST
jgi:signal transduction histidine kinase